MGHMQRRLSIAMLPLLVGIIGVIQPVIDKNHGRGKGVCLCEGTDISTNALKGQVDTRSNQIPIHLISTQI